MSRRRQRRAAQSLQRCSVLPGSSHSATVGDEPVVRAGAATVATVLGVRAGFGFAGRTDLLVPGSDSRRFRHLDRMGFSPLCLALGIGAAWAAFRSRAAP